MTLRMNISALLVNRIYKNIKNMKSRRERERERERERGEREREREILCVFCW